MVVFFQDEDGSVPLLEWLDRLLGKAQAKCLARLKRLKDLGHELRRPDANYLRDGIHELRASLGGVHYRILYFFYGNTAALVSHRISKKQRVPPREIERAINRKNRFTMDPARYTFQPEHSYWQPKRRSQSTRPSMRLSATWARTSSREPPMRRSLLTPSSLGRS